MGVINNFLDRFNKAEFTVAPNKKLKTISTEFKEAFGVALVFYKGNKIAEGDLTLKQLNLRTAKEVTTSGASLKIKANMKVGDVERLFDTVFGVTIQIKDKDARNLVPNEMTIGQAARGEYKK